MNRNTINAKLQRFISFYLLIVLSLFLDVNNVLAQDDCEIIRDHGLGYTTAVLSVTDNGNNAFTIVLSVKHNGCPGPVCKELSNYAVEALPGTYSGVSVAVISGNMTYS